MTSQGRTRGWRPKHMDTTMFCSIVLFVVSSLSGLARGEMVMGEETQDFDFDGLPGVQHEFKVNVLGNTEECFFQPVSQGSQFHVNYEVLKGGNHVVDVYIRDENWEILEVQQQEQSGIYTLEHANAGTYAVCIDNSHTRFGSKLVYIFIVTFVMQEWTQFQIELSNVHIMAENFSHSLHAVQESVSAMKQSQTASRFNVIRDWYLLNQNRDYVYYWSLAQCILIVVAALIQVYSFRRMFANTNVSTPSKPRA